MCDCWENWKYAFTNANWSCHKETDWHFSIFDDFLIISSLKSCVDKKSGLHFSIQVCLHFNWCATAGKIENMHLPMQVPFFKIQKTIQGPKELNEKIDNLHWQCKSPSGTRIVPILARERDRQNGQLIPAVFIFQSPKCIFWDGNETEKKQKPFKH